MRFMRLDSRMESVRVRSKKGGLTVGTDISRHGPF